MNLAGLLCQLTQKSNINSNFGRITGAIGSFAAFS